MRMQEDNYNYGLALLRIWMCFEVVCCHFWKGQISRAWMILDYARDLAVPCFMVLSFYLFFQKLSSLERKEYKKLVWKRLWRIAYPQIAWTFLIWIIEKLSEFAISEETLSWKDLLWQLFTGHSYNSPMWFQIDLLIITLLIFLLFGLTHNKKIQFGIITVLLIFSYFLQYTAILYVSISSIRTEIRYPIGRLIEMIPFVAGGYYLVHFEVYINKFRKIIIILSCTYLIFYFWKRLNYLWRPEGFNYQGIMLLGGSITIFVLMSSIPTHKIPLNLKKCILKLSRCTMGVYCMHVEVGIIIDRYVMSPSCQNTLFECLIIYSLCMVISMIFGNVRKKYINRLFT